MEGFITQYGTIISTIKRNSFVAAVNDNLLM